MEKVEENNSTENNVSNFFLHFFYFSSQNPFHVRLFEIEHKRTSTASNEYSNVQEEKLKNYFYFASFYKF